MKQLSSFSFKNLFFSFITLTLISCAKITPVKIINEHFTGSWNMKITEHLGPPDSLSFPIFTEGIYTFQPEGTFTYINRERISVRGTFEAIDHGPVWIDDWQGNGHFDENTRIKTLRMKTTLSNGEQQSIELTDIRFINDNEFTGTGNNLRPVYNCIFTRKP